ncbi:MAG: tRNA uridine-5-carboxymethylaminomethyl(34) synthesis GTPase MnmE [Bacteroidales bacterium]|nr:tRNA uridine-5-carboxymethylaminomethyl(34) synthesis GTPase MnmE [Bacteroidales bacterium]
MEPTVIPSSEQRVSDLPHNDTICAISTPHGVGGIAVIRVSGPCAFECAQRIWRGKNLNDCSSHTAHLGWLLDSEGRDLDQAVATVFRVPNSFTGEDVVELSVHGSLYVQQELLHALIANGARLAEAGEFTRRAYSAGHLDLAQAEAVADMIASSDRAAHRLALNQMRGNYSKRLADLRNQMVDLASLLELELDFSEEDVEFASRSKLIHLANEIYAEVTRLASSFRQGQAIKNGIPVAIVGATNAGKSSLLNALLADDRAIVSDIHGTTRDVVEDTLRLGDYTFRIMDTAGIRHTTDTIEAIGIERSQKAAQRAHILLCVFDQHDPQPITLPATDATPIIIINKSDLPASPALNEVITSSFHKSDSSELSENSELSEHSLISISIKSGSGLETLKQALIDIAATSEANTASILVTNQRHYQALRDAADSIARAIDGLNANLSGDLVAQDIRLTIHHLSSILGDIPSTELLATIFSRFCIGK